MKKAFLACILFTLLAFSTLNMFHIGPSVKAALNWNINTVDASAPNDEYIISSIALDSYGNPHIAYSGYQGQLKYAVLNGSWGINNVGVGGVGQEFPSLALDSGDVPHISYTDGSYLKMATWGGGAWSTQTVDSTDPESGRWSSLKLDLNGNARICYVADVGALDVKYASWTGSTWSTENIASSGYTGYQRTSLALDSNSKPHACWYHTGAQFQSPTVYYSNKTGDSWGPPVAVASGLGTGSGGCSIALDSFDRPYIAYYEDYFDGIQSTGRLRLAKWTGTTWSIETVDSYQFNYDHVGEYPSLFIDYMDRPHISYYDYWSIGSTNYWALKYARWTGSAWSTEFVDGNNLGVADWSSLTVSTDGKVHISYCDRTKGDLKYATTTIPNFDSHEYFFQIFYTPLDTDGDGKNNALKLQMDADSTYGGTQKVKALSFLRDPLDQNCAYNWSTWAITDALYEYGEATLYVPPDRTEGWYDAISDLYDNANHYENESVSTSIAYLYPTVQKYTATIWAWDALDSNGWIAEPITMDGTPTGFSTPYTFTELSGTHTFTVPNIDVNGRPFSNWFTGELTTTITVEQEGTYTARYGLPTHAVNTWFWGDDTVIKSVDSGDVDGDTKSEVVTGGYYWDGARYNAQLCVWSGTTFGLENVKTWYWTSTTLILSVDVGDVDGDGQAEIVTGGYYRDGARSNAQLCVWSGATLALENIKTWYWAGDTEIVSVAIGDVDADSNAEIVTGGSFFSDSFYNAQLCVWSGATLALENVKTWRWTGFTYINSVVIRDADGDGQIEIVTGGSFFDNIRFNAQLCVWNGATLALENIKTWYWTGNTNIYSVDVGDIDGDSQMEIVTAGDYKEGTRVVAQLSVWNGATLALENIKTWYWTADTSINSVAVKDVDSDAQQEIITGGYFNDGSRTNAQLCIWSGATLSLENVKTWYWTGNTAINSVAVGDIDGDSLVEITTGGTYYDGVRIVAQLCVWA